MSKSETVRTIYALAQRPNGVTSGEVVAVVGGRPDEAHSYIRWMRDSGRLETRTVAEGRTRSRFHADPAVSLPELEMRLAAATRARKAAQVKRSDKSNKGITALPRGEGGPVVEYRMIGGRRVKVTVCPGGVDTRLTVKPSEFAPLFECLGAGRYLDRDTAIARAYRGRA